MLSNKIGIYPGTFDPVTAGHIDIILRAVSIVEFLYIAVAADSGKSVCFTPQDRVEMIEHEIRDLGLGHKVKVISFTGLLVRCAKEKDASVIIRGLRAVSDFEYEFQMACMNFKLDPEIQTIFLPASEKLQLVSSKLVKEVIRLGGDVQDFTSKYVSQKLKVRFGKNINE